ncbi:MAG: hypothetical protein KC503_41460 [Myxococcales bacterium]|nr:hypothetical protein [Myxococcales bacterium]
MTGRSMLAVLIPSCALLASSGGCSKPRKYKQLTDIPSSAYTVVKKHSNGAFKLIKVKRALWLRGMLIKPTWGDVEAYEDGRLAVAQPAQPVTIDGFKARGGAAVSFDREGKLSTLHLAEPLTVGKVKVPQGAWVRVHDGKVIVASDKKSLRAIFRPNGEQIPTQGPIIEKSSSGAYGGTLAKDAAFGALTCKAGTFVFFAANGKPTVCTLAKEATIGGKQYAANTGLKLDDKGAVTGSYDPNKPPVTLKTKAP